MLTKKFATGRTRLLLLAFVACCVASAALVLAASPKSSALSGGSFQAGRIIDDPVFTDKNSLSANEIQSFLNSKVPTCDTNGTQIYSGSTTRQAYSTSKGYPPPYTCLKDYRQDTPAKLAESGLCNGYSALSNQSSAQIIWGVSQSCGVSPKVLIVLLQKEQALVTDDWPWSIQYRSATGYGCPDTAPCDAEYYGFFNQVYSAARQFKRYKKNPELFGYRYGKTNYIQYNPSASCGGSNVYIQNQSTASLYNYTPYQPNASALNNLYGSGDNCGAYGNRNFWRMFNDWFGSTLNDSASADTYAHPDGTLIKYQTDPRIYLIQNGQKRHVGSLEIFMSYRYSFMSVKPFTTGDLALPFGSPITNFAPGTILKTSASPNYYCVYTINDGTQRLRTVTPTVFNQMGLKASRVVTVSAAQLPTLDGQNAQASDPHPNGTLVMDPTNLWVYMIGDAQKRHIPSPNTLFSHRLLFSDIVTANTADRALPTGNAVNFSEGQLLIDGNGRVSVINITTNDTQELRHIPAPFILFGLRYSWLEVMRQDVTNIPLGQPLQPQI